MPEYFYRVTDEDSVGILRAGAQDHFDLEDAEDASEIVLRHADWGNRRPTPLISVTDSRDKAIYYAKQREKRSKSNIRIWQINRTELDKAGVGATTA